MTERCPHCSGGLVPRADGDRLRAVGATHELCGRCGGSGFLSGAAARLAVKRAADAKDAAAAAGACC